MRKWIHRAASLGLLVVVLMSLFHFSAMADETYASKDGPGTAAAMGYAIDTESEIYRICEELSKDLSARQILVYDSSADEILYAKTIEGGKLYPASITKLYSCYVALQYMDPDEVITVGDELSLVQPGSSMAYIYKNQRVQVRTAVEAMLLPSGNDAAMILAANTGRKIAGNSSLSASEAVRVFVAEMNRMAEELGFEKSHFTSPDGYHMGSHYTCVSDMARIARLALENPTISKYMKYAGADVTYASGQTNHWDNTNLLLHEGSGYYRSDAIGMKTGFTNQAGYSLMSAFTHGDGALVIGVFGCSDEYARFRDTIKLVNTCKEALK